MCLQSVYLYCIICSYKKVQYPMRNVYLAVKILNLNVPLTITFYDSAKKCSKTANFANFQKYNLEQFDILSLYSTIF